MSARVPSRKQYELLAVTAGGLPTVLTPGRRDFSPLLRRGWTEPNPRFTQDDGDRRYLQPQQITPAGLRALADAMERYEGEGDRA